MPDDGVPHTRWELPAAESYVLLEGPSADGKRALKLALLELVARRRLAVVNVEEQKRFGRIKHTAVLRSTGGAGRLSGSLASVMDHYDRNPKHSYTEGIPVTQVARAVAEDGGLSGWVKRVVLPQLQIHGLYEQRTHKSLGIFSRTRWERTAAGELARADLVRRTGQGERGFRDWVDTDPARALAFVGVSGSSLLLMDALHPDIRRLREQASSDSGVYFATGGDEAERNETVNDISFDGTEGLDANAFDLELNLGAFDTLDSAFDAIDAGVDSGGDGGGGDGGGGD